MHTVLSAVNGEFNIWLSTPFVHRNSKIKDNHDHLVELITVHPSSNKQSGPGNQTYQNNLLSIYLGGY